MAAWRKLLKAWRDLDRGKRLAVVTFSMIVPTISNNVGLISPSTHCRIVLLSLVGVAMLYEFSEQQPETPLKEPPATEEAVDAPSSPQATVGNDRE